MPTKTLTLRQKLVEIRKSVPYLQKASRNESQKFNYTSSSQVITAVRDKFNEYNILMIPAVLAHDTQPSSTGNQTLTGLTMEYTLFDCDSGESLVIPWYSQGADQQEKGVGKAFTYSEKYFLLKLFQIPTDKDDPDAWADKTKAEKNGHEQAPEKGDRKASRPKANKAEKPAETSVIGPGALTQLIKALGDAGIDESAFTQEWGWKVDEVPTGKFNEVMTWAEASRSTETQDEEGDIFDV